MAKTTLTATHRRALAINLRFAHQLVTSLREAVNEKPHEDLLTTYHDPIPEAVHEELLQIADEIEQLLEEMVRELDLSQSQESIRRRLAGATAVCWEAIAESSSQGLRGYGEVPAEAAGYLDSRIKALAGLLLKLSGLLAEGDQTDQNP